MSKSPKKQEPLQKPAESSARERVIVERRVISKAGAAMRVTELVLSPNAQRSLETEAPELGQAK